LALGLLFGLVVLIIVIVVMPLISMTRDYQDHVEDLEFRLNRLQKVSAERKQLVARLEQQKSGDKSDETFLPTEAASLASADLQSKIKEAISNAGGELTSTQVIPEHDEEQFTRIGVKVRMNGSSPILKQVLYRFESAKPYLFVENLNIRPIRVPRNPNQKNQVMPDKLSIDFDVVAFMRRAP
jgi:general secretion pathway protein M